jgi:hypothetical protein
MALDQRNYCDPANNVDVELSSLRLDGGLWRMNPEWMGWVSRDFK